MSWCLGCYWRTWSAGKWSDRGRPRIAKSLNHYRYEVIVVDDGSPDGTAEVAMELSHKYPVRVIHRLSEKGLASAVVAGFKNSEAQVLGVMDADLQHLRCASPS